jgi:hypothetical protein
MTTLTVVDFKKKLKDRNLPTSGSKNEMVKRLLEARVPAEELLMIGQFASETRKSQSGGGERPIDHARPRNRAFTKGKRFGYT